MQLADGVHEIESRALRAKELGAPEGELLSGSGPGGRRLDVADGTARVLCGGQVDQRCGVVRVLCHLHIGIHREANYSSTTGSPCDHHHAMYGYGVKPYVRSTPWLATTRSCSLRFTALERARVPNSASRLGLHTYVKDKAHRWQP